MRRFVLGISLLALTAPLAAQVSNKNAVLTPSALPGDVGESTRRVEFVFLDDDVDDGLDDDTLDLFTLNWDDTGTVTHAAYLNDGAGNLARADATTDPGNPLYASETAKGVAFADVDADGDTDAYIALGPDSGVQQANRWMVNNGGAQAGTLGDFIDVTAVVAAGGEDSMENEFFHSYDAEFADLNGDGGMDLVVANRGTTAGGPEVNNYYLSNLDGTFSRAADTGLIFEGGATPIVTDSRGSRELQCSDLDLDGDLDIVIANAFGGREPNDIYVNMANNQAGDVANLVEGDFRRLDFFDPADPFLNSEAGNPLADSKSYGIDVEDLDGDGAPDIVVANRNNQNWIFRNVTGAGGDPSFSRIDNTVLATNPFLGAAFGDSYDVEIEDVNGDGFPDIVVANRQDANGLYLTTPEDNDLDGDIDADDLALLFDQADPQGMFKRGEIGEFVGSRGSTRAVAFGEIRNTSPLEPELADVPELAVANSITGTNVFFDNAGAQYTDFTQLGGTDFDNLGSNGLPPRLAMTGIFAATENITFEVSDGQANAAFDVFFSATFQPTTAGGVTFPFVPATALRASDILDDGVPNGSSPQFGLNLDGTGSASVNFQVPGVIGDLSVFYFQVAVNDTGIAGNAGSNVVGAVAQAATAP